jgi:hypothetical protein
MSRKKKPGTGKFIRSGKSPKQAVAIAERKAKKAPKKPKGFRGRISHMWFPVE